MSNIYAKIMKLKMITKWLFWYNDIRVNNLRYIGDINLIDSVNF